MTQAIREGSPVAQYVPGSKRGVISRKLNKALGQQVYWIRSYNCVASHEPGDRSVAVVVNVCLRSGSDLGPGP